MERRLYSRVIINLMANFIKKENEPGLREFAGNIKDICEEGIRVEVSNDTYGKILDTISLGDRLSFQAADEYEFYHASRFDVFSGDAKIVRIEKTDGFTVLGCKVTERTNEFFEYVTNKKIAIMYSNMEER